MTLRHYYNTQKVKINWAKETQQLQHPHHMTSYNINNTKKRELQKASRE